ncbi:alpha hydrolase-12 [Coleophoma cylindrospora]|uniref:Alpha hydrolase-12 n=1 Tax=Coleophoma cylindrospora TaxID=1849047 RepID=A0A3D8RGQ0_9HELO|nr:alpha hydrolase-12 [Coleophoma cylindrospora]
MKTLISSILFFAWVAVSSPTPIHPDPALPKRALPPIPVKITTDAQLTAIVAGIESDVSDVGGIASAILQVVAAVVPSPSPASVPLAVSSVASVIAAHPTNFIQNALDLALNGLTTRDLTTVISSFVQDSTTNLNLITPLPPVFPKKSAKDAPYSQSETVLRGAIYIPPGFKYGVGVQPVIMVPGTGAFGYENFAANLGKEFTGSSYADPVYLNIPGAQLDDAQVNAEFVAYAINYISAISNHKNVALVAWSQGSLSCQWALQYWPSTRSIVNDLVLISGDLHGTQLAYLLCPGFPKLPCAPSITQQEYNSQFIATLRNGGGASAYVPTTSVYSIFDEVVQPQAGTGASAYVLDSRQVGVSNTELQNACTVLQPGGTLYTHEGVLYNALAFALAKDALTHPGPGLLSRIDVGAQCQKAAADGLSVIDILATEATIPLALLGIVAYPANKKVLVEPAIKAYARKDIPK